MSKTELAETLYLEMKNGDKRLRGSEKPQFQQPEFIEIELTTIHQESKEEAVSLSNGNGSSKMGKLGEIFSQSGNGSFSETNNYGKPSDKDNEFSNMTKQVHRSPIEEGEFYEIKIEGHLEGHWSERFEDVGLTVTKVKNGETTLFGAFTDQDALHRLIAKVRDLKLKLLSLKQVERKWFEE